MWQYPCIASQGAPNQNRRQEPCCAFFFRDKIIKTEVGKAREKVSAMRRHQNQEIYTPELTRL
jgi:hypothetical protein